MKKVGVPDTPLSSALATSSVTRSRYSPRRTPSISRSTVEAELARVVGDVGEPQRSLVAEEHVVHLPEAALGGCCLGGLGGQLSVRVHVIEREMTPYVAHVIAMVGEQFADDLLRLAAVGALKVAVLDEGDGRIVRATDVVTRRVDVLGEVEDVVRGAAELARANARGQMPDRRRAPPR